MIFATQEQGSCSFHIDFKVKYLLLLIPFIFWLFFISFFFSFRLVLVILQIFFLLFYSMGSLIFLFIYLHFNIKKQFFILSFFFVFLQFFFSFLSIPSSILLRHKKFLVISLFVFDKSHFFMLIRNKRIFPYFNKI